MSDTSVQPDRGKLFSSMLAAGKWSFALNLSLACLAALLCRYQPDLLISATRGWVSMLGLRSATGPSPTEQDAQFVIWTVCVFLSALFDLVVSFQRIHHEAITYKMLSCFSLAMARKIISLDVINTSDIDHDRIWAEAIVDRSRLGAALGAVIQGAGVLLFVTACLIPWVLAGRILTASGWYLVPLVVAKLPGVIFAAVEMPMIAIKTWRRQF